MRGQYATGADLQSFGAGELNVVGRIADTGRAAGAEADCAAAGDVQGRIEGVGLRLGNRAVVDDRGEQVIFGDIDGLSRVDGQGADGGVANGADFDLRCRIDVEFQIEQPVRDRRKLHVAAAQSRNDPAVGLGKGAVDDQAGTRALHPDGCSAVQGDRSRRDRCAGGDHELVGRLRAGWRPDRQRPHGQLAGERLQPGDLQGPGAADPAHALEYGPGVGERGAAAGDRGGDGGAGEDLSGQIKPAAVGRDEGVARIVARQRQVGEQRAVAIDGQSPQSGAGLGINGGDEVAPHQVETVGDLVAFGEAGDGSGYHRQLRRVDHEGAVAAREQDGFRGVGEQRELGAGIDLQAPAAADGAHLRVDAGLGVEHVAELQGAAGRLDDAVVDGIRYDLAEARHRIAGIDGQHAQCGAAGGADLDRGGAVNRDAGIARCKRIAAASGE